MKKEIIGKTVVAHPWKMVALGILITLIFGYYAAQMSMTADFKSFMPDNEVAQAYTEVNDEYAGVEMVQILDKHPGGNAVSKQSLIDELRLEKHIMSDSDVRDSLQTPDNPENSIYSLPDIIIMTDVMSKEYLNFMNTTINSVPSLEGLNSSIAGINAALAGYLYQYALNSSSENTTASLDIAYAGISSFLSESAAVNFNISMPRTLPSMTIDQKISYLENMSDSEIKNILAYGFPLAPSEMMKRVFDFEKAVTSINSLSEQISMGSASTAQNIGSALRTSPVRDNRTINSTFSAGYAVFQSISQEFSAVGSEMQGLLSSMSPSSSMSGSSIMKSMISGDFNSTTCTAEATMMMIQLNGTRMPEESDSDFSDRMLSVHREIKKDAEGFQGTGVYEVFSTRLMNEDMMSSMNESNRVLLPSAFLLVIIILIIIFRNIIDTLLGLLGLFMAIIWTYGFGVMANMTFNQITTTTAVLIVGLGIDYAIHTIMRYREELKEGTDVNHAVSRMEANLGAALILATVTTMASFLSNLSSPIPPIRDFGIMNAFGIFSAFVIFITFVPAVKAILDRKKERKGKNIVRSNGKRTETGVAVLNRVLALGAVGAEHHPWKVITVVLILTVAGIYGAMNLSTNFSETDFLPSNTESSHVMTYIMDNFQNTGTDESYILVKGNISSPQLLKSMDAAMNDIKGQKYISSEGSYNIVTIIRDTEKSNATFAAMVRSLDTDNDGLPDSSVSQVYDYLYAHDARARYVLYRDNGVYESALMRIKTTSTSNSEHAVLYDELKKDTGPLKDAGFSAEITGGSILMYVITTSLQNSQWNSLLVTIISSLIVLVIAFYYLKRSVMLGIITTIPVVIALIWSMGLMYLGGIQFNVMTVTITSLTIGIGVTYSIHLAHRFTEEMDENGPEEAARITVRHTGSAIFGAAATTMAGFGVFSLSTLPPLAQFGIIATMSIFLSFLLSVFILPTFLVVWARKRRSE